jgi:hypothetical protein
MERPPTYVFEASLGQQQKTTLAQLNFDPAKQLGQQGHKSKTQICFKLLAKIQGADGRTSLFLETTRQPWQCLAIDSAPFWAQQIKVTNDR